ncbi:CinA family protein [Neptuniibacter sp.]|uniref:CinA family protein n=1 Tax=Neptuniibacter sp. TaxID=1962643 RepID=UPI002625882E|nr:CinA family protein [Neptuniibacter sp.]MCP4596053.1 CinA family protein [Neptuniibacter sp.]
MNEIVYRIAEGLTKRSYYLAVAESCTGGWIAQEMTAVAGSSEWFDCGFVTYSNESKQRMLGVAHNTLEQNGAVSQAVVAEMAEGVLSNSRASIGVATSGIAGPGGGSNDKPVGTVWFAWAEEGKATRTEKMIFSGDRESVRKQAVSHALQGILKNLSS